MVGLQISPVISSGILKKKFGALTFKQIGCFLKAMPFQIKIVYVRHYGETDRCGRNIDVPVEDFKLYSSNFI